MESASSNAAVVPVIPAARPGVAFAVVETAAEIETEIVFPARGSIAVVVAESAG